MRASNLVAKTAPTSFSQRRTNKTLSLTRLLALKNTGVRRENYTIIILSLLRFSRSPSWDEPVLVSFSSRSFFQTGILQKQILSVNVPVNFILCDKVLIVRITYFLILKLNLS